jgi:hypothetical protein
MLGGLDLSGFTNVLPPNVAAVVSTAFPLLAGLVYLIRAVGDFADDGQINGSFKLHPVTLLVALAISLMATSCAPGVPWSVMTPYGDAHSDEDGAVHIAPKPIVIPQK